MWHSWHTAGQPETAQWHCTKPPTPVEIRLTEYRISNSNSNQFFCHNQSVKTRALPVVHCHCHWSINSRQLPHTCRPLGSPNTMCGCQSINGVRVCDQWTNGDWIWSRLKGTFTQWSLNQCCRQIWAETIGAKRTETETANGHKQPGPWTLDDNLSACHLPWIRKVGRKLGRVMNTKYGPCNHVDSMDRHTEYPHRTKHTVWRGAGLQSVLALAGLAK
jgi:hypothetical protein